MILSLALRHPALARLALLACLIAPQDARDDFEARLSRANQSAIQRLIDYAEWCGQVELNLEREKALQRVLDLDPLHADAHRGLKHKLARDGTWTVPKESSATKNYRPGELVKAKKRYAELSGATCAEYWSLTSSPGLAALRKEQVEALILALDPGFAPIRAARGETLRGESWVLAETARALEARPLIRKAMERARDQSYAITVAKPTAAEARLKVPWDACLESPNARVVLRGNVEHGRVLSQFIEAAVQSFAEILGGQPKLTQRAVFYVLCDPSDGPAFLDAYPSLSSDQRSSFRGLKSFGLPEGSHVAVVVEDDSERLDFVVRLAFSLLLHDQLSLTASQATWASEGLGLYLTRELIGTRATWFVNAHTWDKDPEELRAALMDSKANWMQLGADLIASADKPTLESVLTANLGTLDSARTLYGYVLCSFLLETRRERAGAFLRTLGASKDPLTSFETEVGRPAAEFESRLARWIVERSGVK